MATVYLNRYTKARELVEKNGGPTSFAKRMGVSKQYISHVLSESAARKNIGAVFARKIEQEFSLPTGYLDEAKPMSAVKANQYTVRVPMLEVAGSNSNQEVATYKGDVVQEVVFMRRWMRQSVNANDHDLMAVASVRTDKMKPTFTRDDIVLVDTTVSKIDDAGVFVFTRNNNLYINRIQPVKEGLKILCDNAHYETEVIPTEEMNSIVVCGRAVRVWNNNAL